MPRTKKTQTTTTRRQAANFGSARKNARIVVKLIADLIVERDHLAAEVARLAGKKAPPTFLQMVGR